MLANRLRKMDRHWGKWASRQGLQAWRVYDRDLPEFPLAIDRYADWVHVQEFVSRWQASDEEHQAWWQAVMDCVAEVLDVDASQVVGKQRRRQKGSLQYEKLDETTDSFSVVENGLSFEVNLKAYLDTGLFLDHRNTRQWVCGQASGKRVLNLFCYTGSFSVYAASGGADETVSVDLSKTYLDWTRRNLQNNGFSADRHQVIHADVFRYLEEAAAAGERFDLIVMDPPSFSNSKRMRDTLDVQRDHSVLINACLPLLAEDGVLVFSNNKRRFELYTDELHSRSIEEITSRSVPDDFKRHQPHRCWLIYP